MVLTRRAYKAISRWLPNEIITEIIRAAPQADRASLCRVSKLFHALCLPVLYRVVHVQTRASAEAFGLSVLSDTALGPLVRSFKIDRGCFVGSKLSPLVLDVCKTLSNLEDLSMPLSSIAGLGELLLCTFPQLTRCNMGSKACLEWSSKEKDDLVAFLLRHPALATLDILVGCPLTPKTLIPLVHLQQLKCPAALVPFIVAHNLHEARLDWDHREGGVPNEVEKTIVALKSMTHTNVPFVCSIEVFTLQFAEIVDSISRNLPHTKTFRLALYTSLRTPQEPTDQVMNCLPRFTGLVYLSLECWHRILDNKVIHTLRDTEEEDQQTVQAFGDVCPTLKACRLNRVAWKNSNGTWKKYPEQDFREMAGISGFLF
ncbi:hypothetical protein FB451DRAFT_1221120 [Mycena latifolia]|nr:hypothetical protein FB451DRAFT_1221120 [Mycena latifolia]